MKIGLSFAVLLTLLLFPPEPVRANDALDRMQLEFNQASAGEDFPAVIRLGGLLRDRLEAERDFHEATEVALKLAFAADHRGTPAEAIAAADSAHRLIGLSRAGDMRAWDWMLKAKLSGIAVKQLIHEGRPGLAARRQMVAWADVVSGVRLETGRDWRAGQPVPLELSGDLLSMIVRNARYDGELLSIAGRSVEAVSKVRELDAELVRTGRSGGMYGDQLLGFLINEQKFLGFRDEALALQDRLIAQSDPGSEAVRNARFNRAYWRSQWEGPLPGFLEEAKTMAGVMEVYGSANNSKVRRRLLAKMAYAYKEAGFEIGDLSVLIREAEAAGEEMEAFYARRDLALIQRETRDFPAAEANLLSGLTSARAVGRKRAEPNLYREYAILLAETGRPREAVRMAREAIRLTKSFRWIQHLPGLLHILAKVQLASGDTAGLRVTLKELEALLASGVLEAYRALDAGVAIALCHQALGNPEAATAARQRAIAAASREKVPAFQMAWAEKFPLGDITPPQPVPVLTESTADLQPLRIHSTVLPGEPARARFTLSNPTAADTAGTLVVNGPHLSATWQEELATGEISLLADGGDSQLRHALTLRGGEEFLVRLEGKGDLPGAIDLSWEPAQGTPRQAAWSITRAEPDGADLAVTNASLAVRNPFYALRLHHALTRRRGDPAAPVDLRVVASRPMRIELLTADTGELLAVDANGDGQFDGPGDLLHADQNLDGFADLTCPAGALVEVALLIYPLTNQEGPAEASIDVQFRGPDGWETAARDLLK